MIWSQLLYNVFQLWIRCINFRIFKNLEKLIGGLFTFTHQKIYQVGNSLFWVRGVLQISILSGREDSFGMHTLQNKDIPHQAVNEFHLVLLDLSHSRTLKKMTVYCWLVWSKCIFFLGICINSWFFFSFFHWCHVFLFYPCQTTLLITFKGKYFSSKILKDWKVQVRRLNSQNFSPEKTNSPVWLTVFTIFIMEMLFIKFIKKLYIFTCWIQKVFHHVVVLNQKSKQSSPRRF